MFSVKERNSLDGAAFADPMFRCLLSYYLAGQ